MKKIIILFILVFSSLSYAIQDRDININTGLGVFGSRGIFGVSAERFFSENHAATLALGLDFVGATSAVGYKYFTEKIVYSEHNSVWGKCFFLFECDSHMYFGPNLQYTSGTVMKITEGSSEREYKIDPKWLGLVTVGFRDVFKNNMTLDVEISYRSILTGGGTSQTSGVVADDRESIEMGYRAVGINIGLGYLF
jgi:hypothetical protein